MKKMIVYYMLPLLYSWCSLISDILNHLLLCLFCLGYFKAILDREACLLQILLVVLYLKNFYFPFTFLNMFSLNVADSSFFLFVLFLFLFLIRHLVSNDKSLSFNWYFPLSNLVIFSVLFCVVFSFQKYN